MKHSICGFNHSALGITFRLDYTDAQIIRSIIDFRDTGKMKSVRVDGREFFWISYTWLLDELPFCGIGSQKVVGRRFAKYVDCGLMERYIESGNKTFKFSFEKMFIDTTHAAQALAGTKMTILLGPANSTPTGQPKYTLTNAIILHHGWRDEQNGVVIENGSGEAATLTIGTY